MNGATRLPGTVYLVGAGPGDPGLVTVKAAQLIERADAIFYDRLIPPGLLIRARAGAEQVYVGKTPEVEADVDGAMRQDEICARLIAAAAEHETVVRLKGGDPFVFGRGGEEAAALREAGVPFEIVPGVTAGIAAPAYAGIPVTLREQAAGVAFVTGHETPGSSRPDWASLARFPGTLVFYMGVGNLTHNCAALIEAGRDGAEPAAVIERGTMPGQRVVQGPLEAIAEHATEAGIRPPALLVCGRVVSRADELAWFGEGPLRGREVVVTRARAQASGLGAALRELGAHVIELPLLRIEPRLDLDEVREAIEAIHRYEVVAVTSANGAELLFEAIEAGGRDARALAGATVAAIGPATAAALAEHGIQADVIPERAISESLADALIAVGVEECSVLVAAAAGARPVLADRLRAAGAEVDTIALYETVAERADPAMLAAAREADFVTLASASAVANLAAALGAERELGPRLISIGPVTSAAARELGFEVATEADLHTVDGLIAALLREVSA